MISKEFKDVIKTSLIEGDKFTLLDIAFTMKKYSIKDQDTLNLVNTCMEEIDTEFKNGKINLENIIKAFTNYDLFLTVTGNAPVYP